jgi:stringent starvation protein B
VAEESPGSTKPYLVRAIYDWSLDEGFTPQIMVDVKVTGVQVPLSYVSDGKIVLNLHPSSVRGLELGNEYLMFSARFSGRAEELVIPIEAIMAVYARENGHGIVFQADGSGMSPPPPGGDKPVSENNDPVPANKKNSSHLKVVK